MLSTIYFSGVLFIFLVFVLYFIDTKRLYLTDLITGIVYIALSWTCIVFVLTNALTEWMERKHKNKMLISFNKNQNK